MIAFDVVKGRGEREPDGAAAKAVCARALEAGLVVLNAGAHGEAIRILVPLTATDALIDEGLDYLEASLKVPDAE